MIKDILFTWPSIISTSGKEIRRLGEYPCPKDALGHNPLS